MSSNNQLATIVERIEKLEEEKSQIAADIKDVFAEAKNNGYDPKILKQVIALRKKDAGKRREEQEMLSIYMQALGMLADTPLGRAAIEREVGGAAAESPGDFF